jgi:hypothetical protein
LRNRAKKNAALLPDDGFHRGATDALTAEVKAPALRSGAADRSMRGSDYTEKVAAAACLPMEYSMANFLMVVA